MNNSKNIIQNDTDESRNVLGVENQKQNNARQKMCTERIQC